MHIFTYGTLMFPEVWSEVVGQTFAMREASLCGFAIFRVRGAAYPGIVATTADSIVEGVVYLDVDSASIDRLDRFEGSMYRRQTVSIVTVDGSAMMAETYVVRDGHRQMLLDERWTRDEFLARGDLQRFIVRYEGFRHLAN